METIRITAINADGVGIGKYEAPGRVVRIEIPKSLPGDHLRIMCSAVRRGRAKGQLLELLESSDDRVPMRCAHAAQCGGCAVQQMAYESQLSWKAGRVLELFKPYLEANTHLFPILSSPKQWGYRNKMEFSFSSDAKGEHYLGLGMAGGRGKVVDLKECHLISSEAITLLASVRRFWEASGLPAYHFRKDTGVLRTLLFRESLRTNDRLVMVTVSGREEMRLDRSLKEALAESCSTALDRPNDRETLSVIVREQRLAKGQKTSFQSDLIIGKGWLKEVLQVRGFPTCCFKVSPTAFFQPNTDAAELLYARALELAEITEESTVYDLFCGTATLGILAATRAKEVVGIEINEEAVEDARTNIALNQLDRIEIHLGDVASVLPSIRGKKDGIALVDPPRAGLSPQGIRSLLELKADRIVYLSCNPSTQVRDVAALLEAGYKLDALQSIDQFPHTPHVENIALLRRH